MRKFHIIAGVSKNNGIGFENKIPWKIKEDMKFFKDVTCSVDNPNQINAVIMGRKTFESLKEKPLKNRLNIVISSKKYNNVLCFNNIQDALNKLDGLREIESIYVIGGETLYKEAILHKKCEYIYLNALDVDVECDTFFPQIDENVFENVWRTSISERVDFLLYKNKN